MLHFPENGDQNFQKKWQFSEINGTFFSDIFRQNLSKIVKNVKFSAKIDEKLIKSAPNFPEKKCHLFRKIATFFENFDSPFSEKLVTSVNSPKKDHVPN